MKKKKGMVVRVGRCKCCRGEEEGPIYTFTKGRGAEGGEVDVCGPFLKDSGLDLKGKFPRKVRVIFEEIG
jgi:hypothetical protein